MPTVQARTVRRAVDIAGGVNLLAAALDVREENLRRWLEVQLPVPQEVFLKCVDIINAHQLDEISGPNDPRPQDNV